MSNRSGTAYSAPTDADRRPVMLGVSTADGITPVPIEVNPSTGQLQTSASFSASSIAINDGTTTTQKLAVDASGKIGVNNFPATQPVSGTVTANAGTNLNTSTLALETGGNLASIKTNTDKIPSQGQALAAASMPVVLPAAQITTLTPPTSVASTNFPTTVDTNSGNKSASTLRVVLATDQPQLTNKLLVTPDANSAVNLAQLAGNTISSGVGASGTGTLRAVVANDTGRSLQSASGSASSSGNNTLVTAGTNRLKVYAFTLSTTSTTSVTCIFQSGASGTELWRVVLQAPTSVSTGANLVVQPPAWLFATGTATLLNLNLSAAQTVHWSVSYWDEA